MATPDKTRSAAAKKAAATRKRRAKEEQEEQEVLEKKAAEERDRYKLWEDRLKSAAIFIGGLALALNEFVLEPKPRELAVIFAGAAMSLPLALPGFSKK